jgi:hypothetical protein
MVKSILVSVFLIATCLRLFAQKQLTKEEILHQWKIEKKTLYGNPSIWVAFDKKANMYAHSFVDSLRKAGVDSVIVYSVSFPGSFATSRCYEAIPVRTHIVWKNKEKCFVKTFVGKCRYETTNIEASNLFAYYRGHQQAIDTAVIMPSIISGEMNGDKRFSYKMSTVDHQAEYTLCYVMAGFQRQIHFVEYDIEDKRSLFYDYNRKLNLYEWWQSFEQITQPLVKE